MFCMPASAPLLVPGGLPTWMAMTLFTADRAGGERLLLAGKNKRFQVAGCGNSAILGCVVARCQLRQISGLESCNPVAKKGRWRGGIFLLFCSCNGVMSEGDRLQRKPSHQGGSWLGLGPQPDGHLWLQSHYRKPQISAGSVCHRPQMETFLDLLVESSCETLDSCQHTTRNSLANSKGKKERIDTKKE